MSLHGLVGSTVPAFCAPGPVLPQPVLMGVCVVVEILSSDTLKERGEEEKGRNWRKMPRMEMKLVIRGTGVPMDDAPPPQLL